MAIDVARARRDTPGCAQVVHLNNAGAALPPECVTEAVMAHLEREALMGGYEAAAAAAAATEHTYEAVARLRGCAQGEIALIENATRAWDMAFYSLVFSPGDRILTSRAEYASNVIAFLLVARRTGAVVEVVDDDEAGQLPLPARRVPVRRSAAARCQRAWLRHAVGDGPQIPARAARHRIPVRVRAAG